MAPSSAELTRPVSARSPARAGAAASAQTAARKRYARLRFSIVREFTRTRNRHCTVPSPTRGEGTGRDTWRRRANAISTEARAKGIALRLDHQAVDLDRRTRVVRQLAAHGALQLVAVLAAGDLDRRRIDVLAEAGDAIVALRVGARHQARIAALDLGHHLGVANALAAGVEILDEAEERRAGFGVHVVVEAGAARERARRGRSAQREQRGEAHCERRGSKRSSKRGSRHLSHVFGPAVTAACATK